MGSSTGVRLVAGLITISIVARVLGPEMYGVLMLWMTTSAFTAMVTNYGLTSYVLREIGADPTQAERIINEGITAKLILTSIVFTIAIIIAYLVALDNKLVFFTLLAASVSDSFSEFLNAGLRARNRFGIETRIATLGAILHAVIVISAVKATQSVDITALGYFFSRFGILVVTTFAVGRYFVWPHITSLSAAIHRLRHTAKYAVDYAMQGMFGQIDSLVLNFSLGPEAVGLYQAGMRVFLTGNQAATVISNVFLPRVSAKTKSKELFTNESCKIQTVFILVGACFGLVLAVFAHQIVILLFGSKYLGLVELMPFFGLLFFIRFSAGAWGVVLTAVGEQLYRTKVGIGFWVVTLLLAIFLVPEFEVRGWILSLCIGSLFLAIGYSFKAKNYLTKYWRIVGFTVVGAVLFLPFIFDWDQINATF